MAALRDWDERATQIASCEVRASRMSSSMTNTSAFIWRRSARTAKYGARLIGYCLMTNHMHAIAVPVWEESLAKAFGRAHADCDLHSESCRVWSE
jgi:hypothetical protein